MVERLVLAALGALPASVVGRGRTLSHGGSVVERLAGLAARPLQGTSPEVRRGPARGLRLRAEPRSLAWLTGKVEREVQRALVERLQPGQTVVDAGASVGFHALLAARLVGPAGAVLAFEPSPACAASLRTNAELNGLANVTVVEQALSAAETGAFLDRPGEATARLVHERVPGAIEVATTSLDAFFAGRSGAAPALVKIDVEGHEAAVLAGMHDTLTSARPVVIVELHGDRGLLSTLEEAGYAAEVIEPYASVADAPPGAHVLAVPRERR